jgi:hypothetical protein
MGWFGHRGLHCPRVDTYRLRCVVRPDTAATLQAQNSGFVAEATTIAQTARAQETSVMAYARAVDTQVIQQNSINQQLLATVAAGNPATRQVIIVNPTGVLPTGPAVFSTTAPGTIPTAPASDAVPVAGSAPDANAGQFSDTVTSSSLRESDGCATGPQTVFDLNTERIYVITRAVTVSAGTKIDVDWRYAGTSASTGSWTVPQDETNYCIHFWLDEFSAGNWTVQLSANGVPVAAPIAFTVSAAQAGG